MLRPALEVRGRLTMSGHRWREKDRSQVSILPGAQCVDELRGQGGWQTRALGQPRENIDAVMTLRLDVLTSVLVKSTLGG